jgi:hypothetical protein
MPLTSFGNIVAKELTPYELKILATTHEGGGYVEHGEPLFDKLLDIFLEISPEDFNKIGDDPSEYIDFQVDEMFQGDEPKWWAGGESEEVHENSLNNVVRAQRSKKADVEKIRADLQQTRTVVTKEIEGEAPETIITTKDPESNTTARKVISADPTKPVAKTVTTKEVGGNYSDELSHFGESQINEDLQPMDLESLINSRIYVDKHKSKLGEDKDVIVLAMEVKNGAAAKDLMTFIERGYTDVIDADNINSENIDGDFMVFVEFERKETFKDVLSEMLDGVEKLTGINEWSFKHYKSNRTLTMEELHSTLPITAEEYDSFLAKEQNIKDQLQQLKINARVPMK